MTEYIDIQPEPTDNPDIMRLVTNLDLTAGGLPEFYRSPQEGEEGSPLAQALFAVPGVEALTLNGPVLLVTRAPGVEWHDLIEDLSAALKDFFL